MQKFAFPVWLTGLFSPLSIAAYVAWGVVWISVRDTVAEREPHMLAYVSVALIVFLAGFASATLDHPAHRWRRLLALHLATVGSALFVTWVWPFGTGNILLVLFAAVLAARLSPAPLALSLLLINGLVMLFMLTKTQAGWQQAATSVLAYASFQAFASLVIRNTRLAEQMAENLRATNAELMTTRLLLAESVRDQERLRMSRELHDVAGHGLTALKLNLGVLARDPNQADPERIGLCAQLADDLLQNLRRVVQQLRAEPGPDLGASLQRIALPFPRPKLDLQIDQPLPSLSFDQVEAVLRAVQEGLTNAARHGNAQTLHVRLGAREGALELHIEDDGRAATQVQEGGGLSGMRERFVELGGSLSVGRGSTGGVKLQARLPLANTGASG